MTGPPLSVGMCFDRTFPPTFAIEVTERLEHGGVDQLWVIEDCFYTAGISLAATVLARSERLQVGLGILPAVARNPAITAMEIATLERLAPGRLLAGIGHGVQSWMEQMGARTPSPLTTLEEVITVVRRLLAGERVSFAGAVVTMDDVALDPPPAIAPPVLAGVRSPRSLALAGHVADGIVLAEGAGPTYVRWAHEQAGSPAQFRISVFTALGVADDRKAAHRMMAPFLAGLLDGPSNPAVDRHPHGAEIRQRHAERGLDGLADMPADRWRELGAIGTFDDAVEHVLALHEAGARDVSLFPAPVVEAAREDLDTVIGVKAAVAAALG